MILHVSPHASALVSVAAGTLLFLHIGGASTALICGPVAMFAPKGGRLHRAAGNVFFVGMLLMSGIGAAVAPFLPQRISSVAGGVAFYLVVTAWMTVRRPARQVGRVEVYALALGLGVTLLGLVLGSLGAMSPHGELDGLPFQAALVFGALAAFGAAGDLRTITHGGAAGAARITRHLWRMCAAMLILMTSFAGQPKAQPEFLRGSSLLLLPTLVVAVVMVYWLVRVRFGRWLKGSPAAA